MPKNIAVFFELRVINFLGDIGGSFMIRIVKTGGGFYGLEIDLVEEDLENIQIFVGEGSPVILVNSLDELEDLGIFEEVEMVRKD